MLEKQAATTPEIIEQEQKNRLWAYKLHEEDIFYNRLNFFLIFESLLMAVVGLILSKPHSSFVLKVIVTVGLIITIFWGYVQARQLYTYKVLVDFLKKELPEYNAVLKRRKQWFVIGSSKMILTYVIPFLISLVWVAFLFLE